MNAGGSRCQKPMVSEEQVKRPAFPGRGSGKDKGFRIPTRGPGFKFQDPHFLAVCASRLTSLILRFLVCEMEHKYSHLPQKQLVVII